MKEKEITPEVLRKISDQFAEDSESMQKINFHLDEFHEWLCSNVHGQAKESVLNMIENTKIYRERLAIDMKALSEFFSNYADISDISENTDVSARRLE